MKKSIMEWHEWLLVISVSILLMVLCIWGVVECSYAEPEEPVAEAVAVEPVTPELTEVDIKEPIEEPVEEEPEPTTVYFDVPLDEGLQDYIFELCEERDIDPAVVIGMIEYESTFDASVIGDRGNSFGLMQVQPRWHRERMDRLGVTNLMDPYQNVLVGIDYLDELLDRDKGLGWALMAYNGGPSNANKETIKVVNYKNTVLSNVSDLEKVG